MVFSLLFTPLGRYMLIGGLIVLAAGGAYFKIRADAVAEIEAAAAADVLKRTQDALRASDALNLSAGRLRERDSNERD